MLLNPLTFHAPASLKEAVAIYASEENVKWQAGGTFLLNQLKLLKRNGARTADHVISLSHIPELRGIRLEEGALRIGAMTTIADIFDHPLIAEHLPVLKTVCRNISTQPIRNMATIGGNLTCRYTWTEMPAVTIGLQGRLHFLDRQGESHTVDPEQFFADQAKTEMLLTAVSFPLDPSRLHTYQRAKKSQFVDIPQLSLLISAARDGSSLTGCRVAVNNCVEFAQRDTPLEKYLEGHPADANLAEGVRDHMTMPIYEKRGSPYKTHLFQWHLRRAVEDLVHHE